MQLDETWLAAQGSDAPLLRCLDAALDPSPAAIGVAISGGGDSTALLHLAWCRASQVGQRVEAVTVDHGLRPEAAQEAQGVARFCDSLGVPHTVLRWNGPAAEGNLQAAARAARYRLIAAWAGERGLGSVLLGHTRDDVAETFLMRLGRKAGLDGLSVMQARFGRAGIEWARPLLSCTRDDLRAYLRRHGLSWVEDPTNDDPSHDRVRARRALGRLAPLGLNAEAIHHSAGALRMARMALDHYTSVEARRHVIEDRGDLLIPVPLPVPDEIAQRLQTRALQWVGCADYPPRWSAQTSLDAALRDSPRHTIAGCLVTREGGMRRFSREWNAVKQLAGPSTDLWDGRWRMTGPDAAGLQVRALGEGVTLCPDWRATGLPRRSLLATPAIWQGDTLVAAPLAGLRNGWDARIVTSFDAFLLSH